jgi:hypothetical protein
MVNVTIEMSEERAAALRARAEREGVSVADLVSRVLDLEEGDELHPEWGDEIRRRIQELDDGTAKARPAAEVFADIRARRGW